MCKVIIILFQFDLFYLIAFVIIIAGTLIYNCNNSQNVEETMAINNKAKREECGAYEANLDGTNEDDERFWSKKREINIFTCLKIQVIRSIPNLPFVAHLIISLNNCLLF